MLVLSFSSFSPLLGCLSLEPGAVCGKQSHPLLGTPLGSGRVNQAPVLFSLEFPLSDGEQGIEQASATVSSHTVVQPVASVGKTAAAQNTSS